MQNFEPRKLQPGAMFAFEFPKDTFVHSDPAVVLEFEARLANDDPLQAWLRFEPQGLRFSGVAPDEIRTIDVVVIARDRDGHEARAKLRLVIER